MLYEKPAANVVRFEQGCAFMTASGDYSTAASALASACGVYNGGATNNFQCDDFGGYGPANPPSTNTQVVIGNGLYTYVFDYKGNHWKLHKGN